VETSLKLQQGGKRYRAVGTIAGRFLRLSLGTGKQPLLLLRIASSAP
jgi:hypothetical protein